MTTEVVSSPSLIARNCGAPNSGVRRPAREPRRLGGRAQL